MSPPVETQHEADQELTLMDDRQAKKMEQTMNQQRSQQNLAPPSSVEDSSAYQVTESSNQTGRKRNLDRTKNIFNNRWRSARGEGDENAQKLIQAMKNRMATN